VILVSARSDACVCIQLSYLQFIRLNTFGINCEGCLVRGTRRRLEEWVL
jgi:hypothetical protein